MGAELLDWVNLLLRVLHVVTAIAWIGASFYFIWLDLSLEPPSAEKSARGFGGELWSIHGGGIYEVGKYRLAPPEMPERLHWFKWEAYGTWLTGLALMVTFYYARAGSQLVGADTWVQTPVTAVAASVAYLLFGLLLYELYVRVRRSSGGWEQALVLLLYMLLASWLAFGLFTPRAAILHLGAALATIMAANVFVGIIPSQKALVRAIETGAEPDAALALGAKRRSTHNNYLTLPVLFCMLAGHAPMVFGHPHAWLVAVGISVSLMVGRQFFNAKHAGRVQPGYLVASFLGFFAVALLAGSTASRLPSAQPGLGSADVAPIVNEHCTGCHALEPSTPGFTAPPGGYVFAAPEDLRLQRDLVVTSLRSRYMPLGNLTGLTDEQRAQLIAWTEAD